MSDKVRAPVEMKGYSLYPRQIATINGYAIAMTDGNKSLALRKILDEWTEFKNAAPHPTQPPARELV